MVWKKRRLGGYYCRVTAQDGTTKIVPTGTTDELVALDTEATALRLRAQKRWRLLDAIVHGRPRRLTLSVVHDADVEQRLDALDASLVGTAADLDLEPLVAQWNGWGTKRRGPDAKYVRQVRRLIPAGEPFWRSQFSRGQLARFLAELDVAEPTKNTYRAALFQFGRWLVERDHLETNPVRDVSGFRGSVARQVWFEPATAEVIVRAITHPAVRAMHALMAATGVEWMACRDATRRDLDLEGGTFFARGGKTKYRRRRVAIAPAPVDDLFAWATPILASYARGMIASAPLFPIADKDALAALREGLTAAGITGAHAQATQHDWRHTFGVAMRRCHADPAVAKRQLGHAPNSIVYETVYSVYLAELGELKPKPASAPIVAPLPSRTARGHDV